MKNILAQIRQLVKVLAKQSIQPQTLQPLPAFWYMIPVKNIAAFRK
jgi:hypothetical protein